MSDSSGPQPGQSSRPNINQQHVQQMVERLYGVRVTKIKELISYDDRNYHILVDEEHSNPHLETVNPHGYVFKVHNSSLDSQIKHLEAEHEAQRMLLQHGINCPDVVRNVNEEEFTLETLANDGNSQGAEISKQHYVRMIGFIPGKVFDEVESTPALLQSIGQTLGQVRNAWQDWHPPALHGFQNVWSLTDLTRLQKLLIALKDEKKIQFAQEFIDTFQRDVQAFEHMFNKCVTHGDFNEMNILVIPENSDGSGNYKLSGILDFGDMMMSYAVYDLAITIAYMVMCSKNMDPLAVGYHVITGYEKEASLNEAEWQVLRLCITARYCQSMVIGYHSNSQDPENKYLLKTVDDAWEMLNTFWNITDETILALWCNKKLKL